ncbi:MAG: hypothetical protein WC381_11370 [Kiritimatiellia bacterium]
MSKILVLNDMLNRACASAPDKVYGLYCGLIQQAIRPAIRAYSDQIRAGKSDEMKRYDAALADWQRLHDQQEMTPALVAEIHDLRVEHGVVEELIEAGITAQQLGEAEVEVAIPSMPIHVIPSGTPAGVVSNFMTLGCISTEAATEFLEKLTAKEAAKINEPKGPGKRKVK